MSSSPTIRTRLVATGFLRLYPDEDNAANLFQRRQEILDDVTDTTSLAFLGLTMGCAQCHDHKFDDIPQTDYYRLQAFFASMAERDDLPLCRPGRSCGPQRGTGSLGRSNGDHPARTRKFAQASARRARRSSIWRNTNRRLWPAYLKPAERAQPAGGADCPHGPVAARSAIRRRSR